MSAKGDPATPVARIGRPSYGEGRDALLDAAIRQVARHGLRGLTVRRVAAEAGVTHGLVAHHFGNRGALIEATLRHAARQSINHSVLEPGTGDIVDMAQRLGDLVEEEAELQAFQYELLLESRRTRALKVQIQETYDEYLAAVRRELDRAGVNDSETLAVVVFAALDGLVLQQLAFTSAEHTNAAVRKLTEIIRVYSANQSPREEVRAAPDL